MTQIGGFIAPSRKSGVLGIHSVDHFSLAVPDLGDAQNFYANFGLDVRTDGQALALHTDAAPHRWGRIIEGPSKKLHMLSFGCYEEDLPRFADHLQARGIARTDPLPGVDSNGVWFRDCDGTPIEIKVAVKSSPSAKSVFGDLQNPPNLRAATVRAMAPRVRPRRLSHVLLFVRDLDRSIKFYTDVLGMRLSDRTNFVAFMHGVHGSDHHMIAFAQSNAPGFHHASWDVGSVNEVGVGAATMASKGFSRGWGLGRHVLGSNFFHYVRDPWGSYCEYSADIDFIAADFDWESQVHRPEDSLSLWGPEPPPDFVTNFEA